MDLSLPHLAGLATKQVKAAHTGPSSLPTPVTRLITPATACMTAQPPSVPLSTPPRPSSSPRGTVMLTQMGQVGPCSNPFDESCVTARPPDLASGSLCGLVPTYLSNATAQGGTTRAHPLEPPSAKRVSASDLARTLSAPWSPPLHSACPPSISLGEALREPFLA